MADCSIVISRGSTLLEISRYGSCSHCIVLLPLQALSSKEIRGGHGEKSAQVMDLNAILLDSQAQPHASLRTMASLTEHQI